MGEFKQMWIDGWNRSSLMRFWRMAAIRQSFLSGVGLFCFGMLACVVQWALNGHHKSGRLYEITTLIAITGDMMILMSIIAFCLIDIGGDIVGIYRTLHKKYLIRKFRKRP